MRIEYGYDHGGRPVLRLAGTTMERESARADFELLMCRGCAKPLGYSDYEDDSRDHYSTFQSWIYCEDCMRKTVKERDDEMIEWMIERWKKKHALKDEDYKI
jgi:hypothetical protein